MDSSPCSWKRFSGSGRLYSYFWVIRSSTSRMSLQSEAGGSGSCESSIMSPHSFKSVDSPRLSNSLGVLDSLRRLVRKLSPSQSNSGQRQLSYLSISNRQKLLSSLKQKYRLISSITQPFTVSDGGINEIKAFDYNYRKEMLGGMLDLERQAIVSFQKTEQSLMALISKDNQQLVQVCSIFLAILPKERKLIKMIKNQNYESAQQSNFIIFICQSSIRIIFKSQLMKEYHGYEYFLRVTPQQINKLSLYNALKKVGQAQLLGTLQLQRVQWQVQCLNKHISLLDQQQKNRKLQKYFNSITTKDIKFEEMIQKNDQIIAQYVQQIQYLEAQINKLIHSLNQKDKMIKQAQSVIILRDQIIHSQKQELKSYQLEIARLKEEIQNRDHRIAEHLANNRQSEARIFLQNQRLELQARTLDQRNQTIRQLNQTIQKQKKALNARQTPIFLKAQFLFGSLIGLIFIACGMAIY